VSVLKKKWAIFAVVVSSILLVSVFSYMYLIPTSAPYSIPSYAAEPFYVGVTYCGKSLEEAKQLIDKVKGYTNLFVLQSGSLQSRPDDITAIGDYAVSSGMRYVVYFGSYQSGLMKNWLDTYDGHWNDWFLGVYFGDELGGRMLDGEMTFYDQETYSNLKKWTDRSIRGYKVNGNHDTSMSYWQDGLIVLDTTETNGEPPITEEGDPNPNYVRKITRVSYYPNGTITAKTSETSNITTSYQNEVRASPNGNLIIYPTDASTTWEVIDNYNTNFTHEELWNIRPFQTYDETAEMFIKEYKSRIDMSGPEDFIYLTSDYALYWFDYKAGYDIVMAQLGWNHTLAQDIALVRGAAELQNKPWGTIITWKYNHPPYLDSGEAIYEQMRMSYECGAEYVIVFNYAEDMTGPYGTLQDEHFDALERFWNDVVQSSAIKQDSIETEAVLVLPENYGWGMRDPEDKIWGLWGPDENSQQIWNMSQSLIDQYGLGLDIVYDDTEFPVEWKYEQTFYWNQTD
jgi:hypothetical protein